MIQSMLLLECTGLIHEFCSRDTPDKLMEKYSGMGKLNTVRQVHGNKVTVIGTERGDKPEDSDGLIAGQRGRIIAVRTADCLPVMYYEETTGYIAAVHAGWKGLADGILSRTVQKLVSLGADGKKIKVAIGPHIKSCCYSVPEERIRLFENKNFSKEKYAVKKNGRWFLNMERLAVSQLLGAGISGNNLDIINDCTKCNKHLSSYRRDGENAGRMISLIGRKQ